MIRPHKNVLLAANGQLDDAAGKVAIADANLVIGNGLVVDAHGPALDVAARLSV